MGVCVCVLLCVHVCVYKRHWKLLWKGTRAWPPVSSGPKGQGQSFGALPLWGVVLTTVVRKPAGNTAQRPRGALAREAAAQQGGKSCEAVTLVGLVVVKGAGWCAKQRDPSCAFWVGPSSGSFLELSLQEQVYDTDYQVFRENTFTVNTFTNETSLLIRLLREWIHIVIFSFLVNVWNTPWHF